MSSISGVRPVCNKIKQGADVAEKVLSFHKETTDVVKHTNEIIEPLCHAKTIGKILGPAKAAALATIPFELYNLGMSIKEAAAAPIAGKGLAVLPIFGSLGTVVDGFVSTVCVAETFGAPIVEGLSAALTPLSVIACAFQIPMVAFHALGLKNVNQQSDRLNALLGDNPMMDNYKAAVDFLAEKPKSRMEQFKQSLFGPLKEKQRNKIKAIFDKCDSKELPQEVMKKTFDDVKKHIVHNKNQKIISIALLIIGIIGVLLVAFAPAVVMPIAWGLLAVSGVLTVTNMIYKLAENAHFNKKLDRHLKGI